MLYCQLLTSFLCILFFFFFILIFLLSYTSAYSSNFSLEQLNSVKKILAMLEISDPQIKFYRIPLNGSTEVRPAGRWKLMTLHLVQKIVQIHRRLSSLINIKYQQQSIPQCIKQLLYSQLLILNISNKAFLSVLNNYSTASPSYCPTPHSTLLCKSSLVHLF